ncbi:uncharacterized protein LOC101735363 [Bombyx mori]|uniref:Uncharacterized protein n=1 Tax=Bombyx mori TaxID=7091 RepID=A0A8R2AJE3_BOMMO|nr:uncharacterized protein LOC101735363 [Bombyx mori]
MSTRNNTKTEKSNESGDTKKIIDKYNRDDAVQTKYLPDRGDSSDKREKSRILDLAERKRIRERYTIRLKAADQNVNTSVGSKTISTCEDTTKDKSQTPSKIDTESISAKGLCENDESIKKGRSVKVPITSTLISDNDRTRIYKVVRFINRKPQKGSIQIDLTSRAKKTSKYTETERREAKRPPEIASGVDKKPDIKNSGSRRRFRRKQVASPASLRKASFSPPTEVAKWAPTCLNRETKPYYEAWVNTKLAAVSRGCDLNDRERTRLMETFRKALECRIDSPELVYEDLTDEKFTGRIRIKCK